MQHIQVENLGDLDLAICLRDAQQALDLAKRNFHALVSEVNRRQAAKTAAPEMKVVNQ